MYDQKKIREAHAQMADGVVKQHERDMERIKRGRQIYANATNPLGIVVDKLRTLGWDDTLIAAHLDMTGEAVRSAPSPWDPHFALYAPAAPGRKPTRVATASTLQEIYKEAVDFRRDRHDLTIQDMWVELSGDFVCYVGPTR